MYCTIEQLINWYGEEELIQRTDREPFTGVINETVLNEAIEAAGYEIDGYLRPVYTLPLSPELVNSSCLPRICGDLVREILYKTLENESVKTAAKKATSWLKDVRAGDVTLGEKDTNAVPTGKVAFRSGHSGIDWNKYG